MTKNEVMQQLEAFGNAQTKKIFTRHGAREPFFGVKIQDLKKIQKKIKKDHELSLQLYETGNSDAMYFAALIADEQQITKAQLQNWVEKAYWYMISENSVAWIAAESKYGFELGLEWIESDVENIAAAGWATLASVASITPDEDLDVEKYSELLDRATANVHEAQNRVRYAMNGFIIAIGSYIPALTEKALNLGEQVGKVSVQMGKTSCKVPLAAPYIQKVVDKGRVGKKRKMARC